MLSRSSLVDVSLVTGADLAVNTKKLLKNTRPCIIGPGILRCGAAQHPQVLRAQCLNRLGESLRRVFARPRFLLMTNNPVHVTAVNSNDGRAAGLTFQCDKAKCFLNARVNEQIGRAMIARKFRSARYRDARESSGERIE